MNAKLELLVIEDQEKYLADVKVLLEGRKTYGVDICADYASSLESAEERLSSRRYDGILSDVFFPNEEGGEEQANGVKIAEYALDNKIPFVLVTSTYHHGRKTNPVNKWMREKHLELVDAKTEGMRRDNDVEAINKNWRGGYLALMYFIEVHKDGLVTISKDGVQNSSEAGVFGVFYGVNFGKNLEELQEEFSIMKVNSEMVDRVLKKYCEGLF